MSDEHLTDHEWKLKMAAEGRAFYMPGKTKAEIEAELATKARELNVMELRKVMLSQADWETLDTGIGNALEALEDAKHIFEALAWADDMDMVDIRAVMRMSFRAIAGFIDGNLAALERLDRAIHRAPKEDVI